MTSRLLFFFCAAAMLLCQTSCKKQVPAPMPDTVYAWSAVEQYLQIAPAPSGTKESEKMAEWIVREASKNPGASVYQMKFDDATPAGKLTFRNIVADIRGNSRDFIIVGAHYDTKKFDSFHFIGANDGGSGVAALLAMIRALDGITPPFGIRFVFFDGEECQMNYGVNDGLHGSRFAAQCWQDDGSLKRCKAMILLDMVGDRELCLTLPADTPETLRRIAYMAEKNISKTSMLMNYPNEMLDDHVPFRDKGIPSIDLIDFQYGPGNCYWHTPQDAAAHISAESIVRTARLALEMIWLMQQEEVRP